MTTKTEDSAATTVETAVDGLNGVQVEVSGGAEGSQTNGDAAAGGGDAEDSGVVPDAGAAGAGAAVAFVAETPAGTSEVPTGAAAVTPLATPEEIARDARRGRFGSALSRAMKEFRPFHSAFQIDRFIVGANGPTPWGAFTQTAREIATRVEALKLDYVAGGRLQVDISGAKDDAQAASDAHVEAVKAAAKKFGRIESDEVRAERVRLDTRKAWAAMKRSALLVSELTLKLDSLRRTINDRERELGRFLGHFETLREQLEAGGELTDERRSALEVELWREKTKVVAAMEAVSLGGLSVETLGLLAALNENDRNEILELAARDRDEVQAWIFSAPRYDLAATDGALRRDEVREIVCS